MPQSRISDAELAELLSLTVEVDMDGATVYRNHLGLLHRVHGPAVIYSDGTKYWYLNGRQCTEERWYVRTKCTR